MTGFPKPVRDLIATRCQSVCERCGVSASVQLHHRRPRGMGGSTAPDTNTASNALALCVACHNDIESQRDEALRMGWLVRQHVKPLDIPVLRRGEWVWLEDNGQTVSVPQIKAAEEPPWM